MFLSVQPLTDASSWARGVSSWVRGNGLEIVLLVIGTILLTRLATWLGGRITGRIDANARETDALVRSEASKHRHALAQVITWATLAIIYCVAAVAIAVRLGIPLASLVAPAAVAGVALGFGAQRIVQDILAGFFIITERQYGFGDLIRLSVPSIPDPAIGTVEDVTLRVTTVRTPDGEVVITPNGQITQVTNLSRDWARAIVDVPVPAGSDVNRVSDLLRLIGEEAYKEPELRRLMLDPPAVMGVQSIDMDHFQIRLVTRTLPGKQFDVARILRARIAAGLRTRASTCRPPSIRPSRPGPTDATSRTSTWILTAVFLVTLVTWVLFKPTQTTTVGNPSTGQSSTSPGPARTTSPPTTTPTQRRRVRCPRLAHHIRPAHGQQRRPRQPRRPWERRQLPQPPVRRYLRPPALSCREPVGMVHMTAASRGRRRRSGCGDGERAPDQ